MARADRTFVQHRVFQCLDLDFVLVVVDADVKAFNDAQVFDRYFSEVARGRAGVFHTVFQVAGGQLGVEVNFQLLDLVHEFSPEFR